MDNHQASTNIAHKLPVGSHSPDISDLPQPIMVLSLPRSGSTLVQRLLSAHPDIETASEPNVLLFPLLSLEIRDVYLLSKVDHKYVTSAISEFVAHFPNTQRDYLSEIGTFARHLYAKSMTNRTFYFLDKSPQYCLIADNVLRAFEHGKFIFLWRHPLAIASSLLHFPGIADPGRWFLYQHPELFNGLAKLVKAYEEHRDRSFGLRYEDLVSAPTMTLTRLLAYLELPDTLDLEGALSGVSLSGTMGDPNARLPDYQIIRKDRADAWKTTFCNPLRKRWASRYLHWIGTERLAIMGYNLDQILTEIDSIPNSLHLVAPDAYWMTYGFFYRLLNGRILRDNLRKWRAGEPFWAYR